MGSKLKLVLLVLLLFGVPALVTVALITSDFSGQVAQGAQPGGEIRGEVLDPGGHGVAGVDVELVLIQSGGTQELGPNTKSDAQGAFALTAPPCNGHYEVRAGGALWQRIVTAVSFLDRNGEPRARESLSLELQPGCQLELTFARVDGRPTGDGEYQLGGEFGSGYLFGLVKPWLEKKGAIKDGAMSVGGLPPMKVQVTANMATGETVELTLELVVGMNRKRIEL